MAGDLPPMYDGKEADSDTTEAFMPEFYNRTSRRNPTTPPGQEPFYRPVLIILGGVHRGTRYVIDRETTYIGRGSEADVQLTDVGVSRRHIGITYVNSQSPSEIPCCFIEDMESRNGTAVNGKIIEGRIALSERDRITIGRVSMGFVFRNREELSQDQTLYESATRDSLTGLDNRQQISYVLRHHLASTSRKGSPLSLLLLDVDHFKSVNDTWGHVVGDEALCHIARLIQSACRTSDLAARWGGEEFAVAFPGATGEQAREVADRLRITLSQSPLDVAGKKLNLTISGGVAEALPGDTVNELFTRADKSLYEAKNSGRNRIILWKSDS